MSTSLAFRPDGKMLVVGDGAGRLQSWDLESGEPGRMLWHYIGGMGPGPYLTSFGPASDLVFMSYRLGWMDVWDPETGRMVGHLIGHDASVSAMAFSADGWNLITASEDGSASTWDVSNYFGAGRRSLLTGLNPNRMAHGPGLRDCFHTCESREGVLSQMRRWLAQRLLPGTQHRAHDDRVRHAIATLDQKQLHPPPTERRV